MRNRDIGIVPAAGRATRLPGCTCSKELVPIGVAVTPDGTRPKAVSEYLIDALAAADVRRVCMVIAPDKHDILRHYGSGARHGVEIAYVCQETPTGMADAIDLAYPWIRDSTVFMGMPDTIFRPADAFARLRAVYEREHADLALVVCPTDEPRRLGPVMFDASGRVSEVLDKPAVVPHNNVWVVAIWRPAFTEFLHAELTARSPAQGEVALGTIFQTAVERGLRVHALPFPDGIYIDAGTPEGLEAARREIASHALAYAGR
jgi:glucose-1-phosphate thymidylyltransferase